MCPMKKAVRSLLQLYAASGFGNQKSNTWVYTQVVLLIKKQCCRQVVVVVKRAMLYASGFDSKKSNAVRKWF